MGKNFSIEDVSRIKRSSNGVIFSLAYKNKVWSKALLRDRLIKDESVQKAALRLLRENHQSIEHNLFYEIEGTMALINSKYLIGFHHKHDDLRMIARKLVEDDIWEFDQHKALLAKTLPFYVDQIWMRILSNLRIKFKAQTFSTPRKRRRR